MAGQKGKRPTGGPERDVSPHGPAPPVELSARLHPLARQRNPCPENAWAARRFRLHPAAGRVNAAAMSQSPDILCIGAVLWDVIGRAARPMAPGDDVPGRITRRPGGVALNVAAALARLGLRPALLGALGRDAEGDALIAVCAAMGLDTRHLFRSPDHPTDIYMAVEAEQGLVAAIADAAGLEAAGAAILAPLTDGRLGQADRPFDGTIVLDGNLAPALLAGIAADPAFAAADLRVSPASPGKAERIGQVMHHPRATVYVNRAEAGLIAGRVFADAHEAAAALTAAGVARALVTDGAAETVFSDGGQTLSAMPPPVDVAHVTGAGDSLMAAHIAAERAGESSHAALQAALMAAARHISKVPGR